MSDNLPSFNEFTVVSHNEDFLLLQHNSGKGTVVRYSDKANQVYNAMPGDAPADGGSWYARATDDGVKYVAKLYSMGYARKIFRSIFKEG